MCTRVAKSDVDYWGELNSLVSYINGTINDRSIIEAYSLQNLYKWVDAAYVVYNNMRSRTVRAMMMVQGMINAR